jgi:hypothetical protein
LHLSFKYGGSWNSTEAIQTQEAPEKLIHRPRDGAANQDAQALWYPAQSTGVCLASVVHLMPKVVRVTDWRSRRRSHVVLAVIRRDTIISGHWTHRFQQLQRWILASAMDVRTFAG